MKSSEGMLGPDSLLVRSTDLVFAEVDDEITMMHVETGKYFGLNRVGAVIWKLIEEPTRLDVICDALIQRFEVEAEQCRADVEAFVSHMAAAGVARISS